jgi:hypothetical protein
VQEIIRKLTSKLSRNQGEENTKETKILPFSELMATRRTAKFLTSVEAHFYYVQLFTHVSPFSFSLNYFLI